MSNKTTLVMWSGGCDSTYVLAHMLRETNRPIHAHHIVAVEPTGRWIHECAVIQDALPVLQDIRQFEFSQSRIDMPGDSLTSISITCFMAGAKCRSLNNKRKWVDRFMIGGHLHEGHNWDRWDTMMGAFYASYYPRPKSEVSFFLHEMVPKQEQVWYLDDIPFWSCTNPTNNLPCGTCGKCKETQPCQK